MPAQPPQTLFARLTVELHARRGAVANYRGVSLNTLIQKALNRYVTEQEEVALVVAAPIG